MESAKIILFSVAATVCFGIVHDLITAHLCIEYFTELHPYPDFMPRDNPIVVGVWFGIVATWWVGAGFGALLAWTIRHDEQNKKTWRAIVRPVFIVLSIAGVTSLACGLAGWRLGTFLRAYDEEVLEQRWREIIPRERHIEFLTDACAHLGAYLGGISAALVVLFLLRRKQKRISIE